MLALGVDPGTLNLGWGVVRREGNRLSHVAHGVIQLRPGTPLPGRLATIAADLSRVIRDQAPEVAAVESLFFHKDAQAAAKLGHARGVVLLCLEQAKVSIAEYAPARVKRTIAGNGQAEKRQVAMMVRAMLGLSELPPADAADALALAITHLRVGPMLAAVSERDPSSAQQRVLQLLKAGRRSRGR